MRTYPKARQRAERLFILALLGGLMLLSGCAGSVRTQLNTFMAPDTAFGQGTIAVQPTQETLQDSLEYKLYRSKLENQLQALGYSLGEPETAVYIARLGYGVEDVEVDERHPNVVFTTGFGGYYRRGGVGVLLSDGPRYDNEYLRSLSLSITRTPQTAGEEPRRVYEVTALSKGSCPIMSVVFDEMLAAVFQNFPGQNGAVKTVTVRGDASCQ